jgi:cytochrome c553
MKVIFSIMIAMFIIGCSEDAAKQEKAPVAAKETVVTEKDQTVKEVVVEKAETIKEVVVQKVETVKEVVVEKAHAVEEVIVKKATEAAASANGALLYSKCAGCHGSKGEKAALGKSAIITNWSATQIADALHGYKDGSYGGAMKGMMVGQVKSLSNADIAVIAEHIAKK